MTPVPADATVVGPDGEIPFVDAFEGRSQLVGYFHMWHPGRPWEEQCPVCTFSAAELGRPDYLHLRDITLALFCEGSYEESRPYADFVHAELPWYSAAASPGLVAGRGFGFFACFLRLGERSSPAGLLPVRFVQVVPLDGWSAVHAECLMALSDVLRPARW